MPEGEILKLNCVRHEITTGGHVYPFYMGAISAKELSKFAIAPSFKASTANQEIAQQVLNPPTKNWQRPLNTDTVAAITERFDTAGEIMPNPVLLAVNPEFKDSFRATELKSSSEVPTGLWEIKVEKSTIENDKPLWIIDGQHRVAGLAGTRRIDPPLPFVILHSVEGVYREATLAKIFAQVTTLSRPLNSIHNAWMQFVFMLGNFAENTPDYLAMKTTALLCQAQMYGTINNPFYDLILFNPEKDLSEIHPGGFDFDAEYLYERLRDFYFRNAGNGNFLTPEELAEEIARAIYSLVETARGPHETSAFFGEGNYQQKYFRDGFLAGVCSYLLENGAPQDWIHILKELKFHKTDWDVSSWVDNTSGSAGNMSKRIATKCFQEVFAKGQLPDKVEDLCNYLQGSQSHLIIHYKLADETGNLISRGSTNQFKRCELVGGIATIPVTLPKETRWIKITSPCSNVGSIEISREGDKYDQNYQTNKLRRGKEFDSTELSKLKRILSLEIKADLYGGVFTNKKLKIKFDG